MTAAAIEVVTIPAYAALSDRIGRRLVFIGGAVAFLLYAFPFFWIINSGSALAFVVATVVGLAVVHPAMYGPLATLFAELFSARVRYSGASIGYQIGAILGGGFAPLILTSLLAATGGDSWALSVYMMLAAVVTILGVYLATELFIEDEGEPASSKAEMREV